jgi:hypothetical protein
MLHVTFYSLNIQQLKEVALRLISSHVLVRLTIDRPYGL